MVSPSTARLMQATRTQYFRATVQRQWGWTYRENRVPYYQRLFQNHDGKRQWWKTQRSPYLLYPFYAILWTSLSLSVWGTFRTMFGHKTPW